MVNGDPVSPARARVPFSMHYHYLTLPTVLGELLSPALHHNNGCMATNIWQYLTRMKQLEVKVERG
jgi:hypothetical protein